MEYPVLKVRERPLTGKGHARKIRALGYIPAVLYGKGMEGSRPLVAHPKGIKDVLMGKYGSNGVVRLEFEDGSQPCMALIKEHSVHPYRRNLLHCDFMKVDEDTVLEVDVPVKVVGKSEGEKLGAKLNKPRRHVTIRCRVADIPEHVEIDVSPLGVGEKLMLSQLSLPEGLEVVYRRDTPVVTVRLGRAEKAAEAEAEEEAEAAAAEGEATPEGGDKDQGPEAGRK